MDIREYFPIFDKLTKQEQEQILQFSMIRKVPQGTVLHNGDEACMGLLLLRSGPSCARSCASSYDS